LGVAPSPVVVLPERRLSMNLYLIKRSPDCFISDAYAYAVVAAETGAAAKHTHPLRGVVWKNTGWSKGGKDYGFATWADPKNVRSRLIGTAVRGTQAGMICTFFN
jgi:hypothetical protein